MDNFILTEFLYHIVSGLLILVFIFIFLYKARHTHFPKEKEKIPLILNEKIVPHKRRVLGFIGKLF